MSSKRRGNLIVISAPSGSGKTSLARGVLEDPEVGHIRFSVSHTTRAKRGKEQHGEDYFFVSVEEFEEMLARDAFLEHARVYGNHYYGTARDFVQQQLEKGRDVILDIDVQGAMTVKRKMPEALLIFVFPPSFKTLDQRLRRRGVDDEEEIRLRLEIASEETRHYSEYDYLIVNDVFTKSVLELKSIVLAARCRTDGNRERAERIRRTFEKLTPLANRSPKSERH